MPRVSQSTLLFNHFLSTIIPDTSFHNRWMSDEEILDAIKGYDGFLQTTNKLLNHAISRQCTFFNLFDLEKAYGRIVNDKGPAVLKDEVEFVKMKLEGSDVIKKEKDEASVETMIDSFGTEKTNARITKFRGGFVLPLFNGYVQYTKLCNKKNLNAGGIVQKEFEARGLLPKFLSIIASKMRLGTQCTEALRTHETQRFNTELNGDLTELGIDFNERMPGSNQSKYSERNIKE